jgi:hypothetical protein
MTTAVADRDIAVTAPTAPHPARATGAARPDPSAATGRRARPGVAAAGRQSAPPPLPRLVPVPESDPPFDVPAGDTVYPAARRHSDFWTDPAFLPQVDRLLVDTRAAAHAAGPARSPDDPDAAGRAGAWPAAGALTGPSSRIAGSSHPPAAASYPSADAAARPDPLSPSAGR